MQKSNTIEITNWLKGLAIFIVMMTHFAYMYDTGFYLDWLATYANAFIAVFFLLSGFGAYHSMEKRFGQGSATGHELLKYFRDRAMRIYPLYWLALILVWMFTTPEYSVEYQFGFHLKPIAQLLGFPLVTSPYWFVTAIIQCYIFAPLIYFLFRKLQWKRFLLLTLAMFAISWQISEHYAFLWNEVSVIRSLTHLDPNALIYRQVFLGNILLFSLGILMSYLVETYGHRLRSMVGFYVSTAILIAYLVFLHYDPKFSGFDSPTVEIIYFFVVFAFCMMIIIYKPRLPLRNLFSTSGEYSYSLYLLHPVFFQMLLLASVIKADYFPGLVETLILSPVFFLLSINIEKAFRRIGVRKTLANSRLQGN